MQIELFIKRLRFLISLRITAAVDLIISIFQIFNEPSFELKVLIVYLSSQSVDVCGLILIFILLKLLLLSWLVLNDLGFVKVIEQLYLRLFYALLDADEGPSRRSCGIERRLLLNVVIIRKYLVIIESLVLDDIVLDREERFQMRRFMLLLFFLHNDFVDLGED